jgi:hypothetical protein
MGSTNLKAKKVRVAGKDYIFIEDGEFAHIVNMHEITVEPDSYLGDRTFDEWADEMIENLKMDYE